LSLTVHFGDGDGLVAVVGDDEEDGKESVLVEVHGEYFRFVGSVVGVGCDGDSFVGVIVVREIVLAGWAAGLMKSFAVSERTRAAMAQRTSRIRRDPCLRADCMLRIIRRFFSGAEFGAVFKIFDH